MWTETTYTDSTVSWAIRSVYRRISPAWLVLAVTDWLAGLWASIGIGELTIFFYPVMVI